MNKKMKNKTANKMKKTKFQWDSKSGKILRQFGITPNNLTVKGDLEWNYPVATPTPDYIRIGDRFYIDKVTALPDNLTVEGDVYLLNLTITTLPDNLTVEGDMYLCSSAPTTLPANLTVTGDLYISYSKIATLPDDLSLGGALHLCAAQIALPNHFIEGVHYFIAEPKYWSEEQLKKAINALYS
ncbi:MAG: hypothetical protein FWC41_02445 [Firmicutes bacterium]|nr:hypothetical protein [Bacillota bacterium]